MSKTLLQLSKLDHANIDVEPVTLNTVASEVVQRYDKNANRIRLKQSKKPLVVKANPSSIEELMTILVDNALKYSPDGSPIKINLSQHGRSALFEITNSGEGIPATDLPHIFDRFYRSDTSRSTGGSGLGLALATDIVTMFKGELSVTSTPGKETGFHFSLPLTKSSS